MRDENDRTDRRHVPFVADRPPDAATTYREPDRVRVMRRTLRSECDRYRGWRTATAFSSRVRRWAAAADLWTRFEPEPATPATQTAARRRCQVRARSPEVPAWSARPRAGRPRRAADRGADPSDSRCPRAAAHRRRA